MKTTLLIEVASLIVFCYLFIWLLQFYKKVRNRDEEVIAKTINHPLALKVFKYVTPILLVYFIFMVIVVIAMIIREIAA